MTGDNEDTSETEEEVSSDEGESLCSEDDITDQDDPAELFNTSNVVVSQYSKISCTKNIWKFQLKDGMMNLKGEDFVFQKASAEAEW